MHPRVAVERRAHELLSVPVMLAMYINHRLCSGLEPSGFPTLTLSVMRLRKVSVQQLGECTGKKGPRMLAFMVMNRLYPFHRSSLRRTSPMAPISKHLLSRLTIWTFGAFGSRSTALVSPLKMKMKSAFPCIPFLTKKARFSRALSDSAYVYKIRGRKLGSFDGDDTPPAGKEGSREITSSVVPELRLQMTHTTMSMPSASDLFQPISGEQDVLAMSSL